MDYGLRSGQPVFDCDGEKLGEVKEVRGEYFKVDAPMHQDYWIACECIRGGSVMGDRVTVDFDKDQLESYKTTLD